MKTYIDVILPLAVRNLYTYEVSIFNLEQIAIGKRVIVPFGKSKFYTALIENIHSNTPTYKTKEIIDIVDQKPIVNDFQLKLWKWVAQYYMCHLGEVFNVAIPTGLKLESETKILKNTQHQIDISSLTENEFLIYEALDVYQALSVNQFSKIVGKKRILSTLKKMVDKNLIYIEENLSDRYKPKLEKYVRLNPSLIENEFFLKEKLENLNRAKKQKDFLLQFMSIRPKYKKLKQSTILEITKKSNNILKGLVEKNILEIYTEKIGRIKRTNQKTIAPKTLDQQQKKIYQQIQQSFKNEKPVLLYGVTSSGKTEVYIQLIQNAIDRGEQVLYLLPEISLTSQIIKRLAKHFGNDISVYHSKYSDNERVEIWRDLANKKYKVILGTRSALFLPFYNLKLIIIDEEHESSYKQQSPAPRYSGRDTGLVLAKIYNANVLLGSATPSLESYLNAKNRKYDLVELKNRYKNIQAPKIELVDIKKETQNQKMQRHFSMRMIEAIQEALNQKEQVIIFQNRRGFAPVVNCNTCGNVWKCKSCDVNLTFHKYINSLRCHYCGYTIPTPKYCNACGGFELNTKGLGTEQIEQELNDLFPNATTQRMDLDTTRKKNAFHSIIEDFENRKIDILVGTQMLTKGLDFENVSLVGILSADSMLYFPDFRAYERAFQLMTQVAGRAGRHKKRGLVIIQSFNPLHTVLQQVSINDYSAMCKQELYEREQYHYPPFYKMIQISLKHRDKEYLSAGSQILADSFKSIFGTQILGPQYNTIPRIQNQYIKNIIIKIQSDKSLLHIKNIVSQTLENFINSHYKNIKISIDVDVQ